MRLINCSRLNHKIDYSTKMNRKKKRKPRSYSFVLCFWRVIVTWDLSSSNLFILDKLGFQEINKQFLVIMFIWELASEFCSCVKEISALMRHLSYCLYIEINWVLKAVWHFVNHTFVLCQVNWQNCVCTININLLPAVYKLNTKFLFIRH